MKVRRLLLVLAMALTGGFATAQSASDMALAKQLAKQQGYSDAQIEAMMNQYNNGGKSTSAATVQTVDRNAAAMDQQQMLMQQQMQMQMTYGIAGGQQQTTTQQQPKLPTGAELIYGHNLFKNTNLNFVPSYNIPTPANYKLSA